RDRGEARGRGGAADKALTGAGSALGSYPRTVIPRAPAASAVVTAATSAPADPRRTRITTWPSGGSARVAGSAAGRVTTRVPGSCAAIACRPTPAARTARGRGEPSSARGAALTVPLDASSSRALTRL